VAHVLVRDPKKARAADCDPAVVTTDPEKVFSDPSVDVVLELMGGLDPARSYIERALDQGITVVTANKLLMAHAGPQILQRAADARTDLAFEASVGGGIPVIRTVSESLSGDRVASIHGILNGTCNYILTRMRVGGVDFRSALYEAQQLGYAEANPSLDIGGHDAAQKLVILSMLAFRSNFADDACPTEGIEEVDTVDFAAAEHFGYTIKHFVIGEDLGDGVSLRAHPALLPKRSVMANIDGALNCVYIQGRDLGPCILVGQGAGALPTAVSVVADLVEVARARIEGHDGLLTRSLHTGPRTLRPLDELVTRYYLRFEVVDAPGVLSQISGALGRHGVSIQQMVQEGAEQSARLLILTHSTREGDLKRALAELAESDFMRRNPRFIRIEDV
jgi:homoserine dehydrogenase